MNDKKLDMSQVDSRLSRIYTGRVNLQDTYNQWADDYDEDLLDELGYVAHLEAARIFSDQVRSRDCRILDVACGTGLAGMELKKNGFTCIEGTDFSSGMLRKAEATGCYQYLFQHDFTRDMEVSGQYDALICVGMFSFGSPPISDIPRLIRCLRPGGLAVITVNGAAWDEKNFEPSVRDDAERNGYVIESIESTGYLRKENIDGRVLIIRSPG